MVTEGIGFATSITHEIVAAPVSEEAITPSPMIRVAVDNTAEREVKT